MRLTLASLAVLALALGAPAAHAATLADTVAAAHAAADQFVALAQGSDASGKPPRASDPAVGRLLDAVFDVRDLPADATVADMGPVSDWLTSANRIGQVYVLAGTGQTDAAKAGADVSDQANRNMVAYAPELGRYMDTEMGLLRLESQAVADAIAQHPELLSDPTRAKGLADIRQGLADAMTGMVTSLPLDGLTDSWREARMPALLGLAPQAARLLTPDQAAGVAAQAKEVAGATGDATLKGELTAFAASLSRPAGS